jgi:hypothetical protein
MSRKLLVRGRKRLDLQLPLNQHVRLNQAQSQGLEVPSDFREFARLCRIRSGANIIPFELYDWQEELSEVADKHVGLICAKTRQLGVTEFFACKMLHKACLNAAYSGAVLSMGGKETSKVAKRVRRMPGSIPGFNLLVTLSPSLRSLVVAQLLFAPPQIMPFAQSRAFGICFSMRLHSFLIFQKFIHLRHLHKKWLGKQPGHGSSLLCHHRGN